MNPMRAIALSIVLATLPPAALAQLSGDSASVATTNSDPSDASGVVNPRAAAATDANSRPFSRIAVGGGFSLLGVHLLTATNLNPYLDLRGDGHFFRYTASNIDTSGFTITPRLSLASAGVSADVYPFPMHGFRVSPGLLFYNRNGASSIVVAQGGTSFTLNGVTYYSSTRNPASGTASLNLHSQNPAFTITTGWGSFFPARGGHWSFPFEIGIALIGAPKVNVALTSGQVCDSTGLDCVNVASNQQVQSNLQAQLEKYDKDVNPLKTFPILGGAVVYNFNIRPH